MTKANFEELHEECSRALTSYMKAATQLCKLLGEVPSKVWAWKSGTQFRRSGVLKSPSFGIPEHPNKIARRRS